MSQQFINRLERGRRAVATAQRNGTHGFGARDASFWTSVVCAIGAAAFWVPLQWALVTPRTIPEMIIAASLGLFMVVGMPTAISMYVPWTKAAEFMARLNLTWFGQLVGGLMAGFLLWYAGSSLWMFWSLRPVTAAGGMTWIGYQTVLGIIATILVPVFLWAPAAPDELAESMQRRKIIDEYEEATRARRKIAREINIQIVQMVRQGLQNLSQDDRTLLGNHIARLMELSDGAVRDMRREYEDTVEVVAAFASPLENAQVVEQLDSTIALLGAAELPLLPAPATGETLPFVTPPAPAHTTPSPVTMSSSGAESAAERRPRPSALRLRPAPPSGVVGNVSGVAGSAAGSHPRQTEPIRPAVAGFPATALRGAAQRFAAEYIAAATHFGNGAFTPAELAAKVGKHERTARDWIKAWKDDGLAADGETRGTVYLTEREVAQ